MYISYEQVVANPVVKMGAALTIPANATQAELQASVAGIAYTMDNATNPTETSGMILLVTDAPKLFLIEDLLRIRFIRFGVANANLNIHYIAGRDV